MPLTPVLQSIIYTANELSRTIDNLFSQSQSPTLTNPFLSDTIKALISQWDTYFTMVSYLTKDDPTFALSDYLIFPNHLPTANTTTGVPGP